MDFDDHLDGNPSVCVGPEEDEFAAQGAVGATLQRAIAFVGAIPRNKPDSQLNTIAQHNAFARRNYQPHADDRSHDDLRNRADADDRHAYWHDGWDTYNDRRTRRSNGRNPQHHRSRNAPRDRSRSQDWSRRRRSRWGG
jgi:hypothetical protein